MKIDSNEPKLPSLAPASVAAPSTTFPVSSGSADGVQPKPGTQSIRDLIDLGMDAVDTVQEAAAFATELQNPADPIGRIWSWLISALDLGGWPSNAGSTAQAQPTAAGAPIATGLAERLPATGDVSEEQLYVAILGQRIQETAGPAAAEAFANEVEALKSSRARPDSYVPFEEIGGTALRSLVSQGILAKDLAERINGEAFAAAQLDDNGSLLYDDRASATDPTKATADVGTAMERASQRLARFQSGIETAPPLSLDAAPVVTPQGTRVDGPDGFLFKPTSDSDGNLVVLVPPKYAHRVQSLQIVDISGNVVADGQSEGYGNGGREHFRFNRPGRKLPPNVTVELRLDDGSRVAYQIPDPSRRFD